LPYRHALGELTRSVRREVVMELVYGSRVLLPLLSNHEMIAETWVGCPPDLVPSRAKSISDEADVVRKMKTFIAKLP
jgi:hypothetical protein